jgi:hypothetical protein
LFYIYLSDKSTLAPEGKSNAFSLDAENGFLWKGYGDTTVDEVLSGTGSMQTKTMQMEQELVEEAEKIAQQRQRQTA